MEAQVIFLNPFTVGSSCKRKFVICPFVYKETNVSYPFANRLNRLNRPAHLWKLFCNGASKNAKKNNLNWTEELLEEGDCMSLFLLRSLTFFRLNASSTLSNEDGIKKTCTLTS
jgi:hypothetical protein